MKTKKYTWLWMGTLLFAMSANQVSAEKLKVCSFKKYPFVSETKNMGEFKGFSWDFIQEAFKGSDFELDFIAPVFEDSSCFTKVDKLQASLGLDAEQITNTAIYHRDRDRNERLFQTKPYYEVSLGYFYPQDMADPFQPDGLNSLKKNPLCGVAGWNYETFGIPDALITKRINEPEGLTIFSFVQGKDCVALLEYESILGAIKAGKVYWDGYLVKHNLAPNSKKKPFHVLIGPGQNTTPEKIQTFLNKAIDRMKADGSLQKLWQTYFPPETEN